MTIRRLAERLAYAEPENPWVRLYFDDVEFPNGMRGRYNRIIEGDGRPGVAILPILPSGAVGLVRPYRYAVEARMWQVPMGYGDEEHPEQDARRELLEETGLTAGTLTSLGAMNPSPGVMETRVALFAAACDEARVQPQLELGEELPFEWLQPAAISRMVAEGEISCGITLATLVRAHVLGLLPL